jgi:glucose-6-phosphate isomerase
VIRILDSYQSISSEEMKKSRAALEQVFNRKDLGFFQIPEREELWSQVDQVAEQIRKQADELVVVGVGGSSLGPKALFDLLEQPHSDKKLHFCDNVDALAFGKLLKRIKNKSRTLWLFVSKSGSTIETLVAADLILQNYLEGKDQFQAVVISENKKNPMTQWAKAQNIPCLEIPLDVGGRFSVLTAVGMLPMAFLGLSTREFRKGAQEALKDKDLVSQLMAHYYQSFSRQEWISFFWFYCSGYENFGRWLQQLWAESLGKATNRFGKPAERSSTPMTAIGSSDQHSVFQQLMEGPKDKFVSIFRFEDVEKAGEPVHKSVFDGQDFFNGKTMGQLISAQAQGTRGALNEQKVSTLSLMVREVSPRSLGFQMMCWQLVVAGLGERLEINAFDQPGVELGKRLAKTILQS